MKKDNRTVITGIRLTEKENEALLNYIQSIGIKKKSSFIRKAIIKLIQDDSKQVA